MKKLAVFIVFFIMNYAYAQVANDDCSNAVLLVPSSICTPTSGSLLNATNSSLIHSCWGNSDVFYKFVAVATSGTVRVTSPLGLDAVVSVMSTCNSSTSLYCVDSYGSGSTEVINMTNLVVGSTYYIKVQAYSSTLPAAFNFTICVISTASLAPTNDDCVSAATLSPSSICSPVSGSLLYAAASNMPNACSQNKDVFYKFVATSANALISVVGSSGLDVVLSVYTSCNSTSALYCTNSTGFGGTETLNTILVSGQTYYIQVQAFGPIPPTTNDFSICIENYVQVVPPVNDECANAINLTTSSTCSPVTGTLQHATTSQLTSSCYGIRDVFYKFTATATAATVKVASSSGLDLVVGVYTACGSNSISCQDVNYIGGMETVNLTGLTVGSVYYIQVQAYASYIPTTYTFTICVQSAYTVIPSNNNCSNAITILPSPLCSPVSGTLLNATSSNIANSCKSNSDVFYLFEATAETATVSVAPTVGMNVAVGVFESCSGMNVSCTDAQLAGGTENVSLSALVVGNTYLVQVQNSSASTASNAGFTICVNSALPPAPVNDECMDAIVITPATTYTPITGTVKNATVSTTTTSCGGNSDVFYKFTAGARTATITVDGSAGFDPVVGLFGACGTSNMDCIDFDYNAGGTEVLTPTNLIVGSTYYIKVQDYSTTLPTTFTFTVAVQSTPLTTDTDASTLVQQISLYPNPTQQILNVENIQMETTLELVDLRGRVLFTKNILSDAQIDLSEFAAGVYILKLSVNGVVENRRVVVSR